MGFFHLQEVAFVRPSGKQQRYVRLHDLSENEEQFVRLFLRERLSGYRNFVDNEIVPVPPLSIVLSSSPSSSSSSSSSPSATCSTLRNVTAFFLPPWHIDNLFHLHANNLVSIIQGIQASPNCNPATLVCDPPSQLFLFPTDAARIRRGVTAKVMLSRIFDLSPEPIGSLFPQAKGAESYSTATVVCVKAVVWGRGRELFYYQVPNKVSTTSRPDEPLPMRDMRSVTDALFAKAVATFLPPAAVSAAFARKKQPPALLILTRESCLDGRALSPTLLTPLAQLAEQHALSSSVLRDADFRRSNFSQILGKLAATNILLGTHGSGLTNILYTPVRGVLIELYPWGKRGWSDTFRNMAWSRGALYISVLARSVKPRSGAGIASLVIPPSVLNCTLYLATLYLRGQNSLDASRRCSSWEGEEREGLRPRTGKGGESTLFNSRSIVHAHVPPASLQHLGVGWETPAGASDLRSVPLSAYDYKAQLARMRQGVGKGGHVSGPAFSN